MAMVTAPQKRKWRPRPLTVILAILFTIALAHFIAVTRMTLPFQLSTNCASFIKNTDYTKHIPALKKTQEMDAVQFADKFTQEPSALVLVNDTREESLLDIYLFGCSMVQQKPTIKLLFKQQGLKQGVATLTTANTLSIGQLDTTLAPGSNTALLPLQENVYREYIWRNGSLQQVRFPGFYPVMSRSEGEALQEQLNYGQPLPWTDPVETAIHMAEDLLKWPEDGIEGSILKKTTQSTTVLLKREKPDIELTVTLARLVAQHEQGLWFVTGASTEGIALDTSTFASPLNSPLKLQGTSKQTQEKMTITLFNHTLASVKLQNNPVVKVEPDGKYTGNITFPKLFPNQPGLLLLQTSDIKEDTEHVSILLTSLLLE